MKNFKEFRDQCTKCELCHLRSEIQVTKPVLPSGSTVSELMVVGEAPGFFEDLYCAPFVGKSGKLLRESLNVAKLKHPYITNIVKCRPKNNSNPSYDSIKACSKWIKEEIIMLKPRIILTLGKFSSEYFLTKNLLGIDLKNFKISKARGKIFVGNNDINIIPTWHPAYILRNKNIAYQFNEDLKLVFDCLEKNKIR